MIGFIKGLFGSGTQSDDTPASKEAFFLKPDDAKTFGDIEFMRSTKEIKRSMPKAKLGEDNEYVQRVSSMAKQNEQGQTIDQVPAAPPVTQSAPATASTAANEVEERRRSDDGMAMFRNMARGMKR